jgi:TRAP-type C4-dicarboxylate transport system permease small subunit
MDKSVLYFLEKLDRVLGRFLKGFCILCMVVLCVVLTGVVLVRFFPIAKLSWSDEVIEWAFAWMVFMGAAALWREKAHFCVDALSCKLEKHVSGCILAIFIETASLIFFLALTHYGYMLAANASDRSPILEWPRPLWYSCIPLAGLIMSAYSVRNLISLVWGLVSGSKECGAGLNSAQPGQAEMNG